MLCGVWVFYFSLSLFLSFSQFSSFSFSLSLFLSCSFLLLSSSSFSSLFPSRQQTLYKALSYTRHRNPSIRSRTLIFRELDRPFETAPKTTHEPTSTKSRRPCIPSRMTRLRRLMRLSSSKSLVCLPPHRPIQFQSKWCSGCPAIVRFKEILRNPIPDFRSRFSVSRCSIHRGGCEDRSLVSPRVKEEPRTPKIMRCSRGQ